MTTRRLDLTTRSLGQGETCERGTNPKAHDSIHAAPMIQSAINAAMNPMELGGDGKIPDATLDRIVELTSSYARKISAKQ